jgi:isocitrate dehydrogenase
VEQFTEEDTFVGILLRVLALGASLEHLGQSLNNSKAIVLSETLDQANDAFLRNDKSPARKVGQIDNLSFLFSNVADALAAQDKNAELKAIFYSYSARV